MEYVQELDKYSVKRDFKQTEFRKRLYDYQFRLLKSVNFMHLEKFRDPTQFNHNKYDSDGVEVSPIEYRYPHSVSEERVLIAERFNNLLYIKKLNQLFEYCRSNCRISDSRLRNFANYDNQNITCFTNCMNITTEHLLPAKPVNGEVAFVWSV